jgi:hypothetical protein
MHRSISFWRHILGIVSFQTLQPRADPLINTGQTLLQISLAKHFIPALAFDLHKKIPATSAGIFSNPGEFLHSLRSGFSALDFRFRSGSLAAHPPEQR